MKDNFELAREAGLSVTFNGKIGREEYHSVTGSLEALVRFAILHAAQAASDNLRDLISDDAYAMSFQTLGQYRSALLKALAAKGDGHVDK